MKIKLLTLLLLVCSMSYAQTRANDATAEICDDLSNDGVELFDFTSLENDILGSLNPSDFTITFYNNMSDASNGVNFFTNPSSTPVSIQNSQYFARVFETATGSFDVVSVFVILYPTPLPTTVQAVTVCSAQNPGSGFLTSRVDIINEINAIASTSPMIEIFLSQQDADNDINPISSNASIPVSPNGTSIFLKQYGDPNFQSDCWVIENITVYPRLCNATSSPLPDLFECLTPGSNTSCFDLSQQDSLILSNSNPVNYSISYHLSQVDADNNLNPIASPYCTSSIDLIFVRFENIDVNTVDTSMTFNVIGVPEPQNYTFPTVEGCDRTGSGIIDYDAFAILTEVQSHSLPSGVASANISYHLSQQDADASINAVGSHAGFTASNTLNTIFVRVEYDPSLCFSVFPVSVSQTNNCLAINPPIDLTDCLDSTTGLSCFDLTLNDSVILAGQSSSSFTVTYHNSLSDAQSNVNAISNTNNYCVSTDQQVYVRLEDNLTGNYGVDFFNLTVAPTLIDNNHNLPDLVECDDDLDGVIDFDLTESSSLLSSSNSVEFYLSLNDAQNQVNPIATPSSYTVAGIASSASIDIFIRELIPSGCDVVYPIELIANANCNSAYRCSDAVALCNQLGQAQPNVFGNIFAEAGNYYPFSQSSGPRNPSWYYIPIETSGSLTLELYQNTSPTFNGQGLDIDFAIYGPFTNPTQNCGSLTANDLIDSSFSLAMPEIATIPNAQAGEFYLLLASNFTQQPGFLKFEIASSSTATVSCDGIQMRSILDVNANGVVDSTDVPFPLGTFGWELNSNGSIMNIATPDGEFEIYDIDPTNSYDLTYDIFSAYNTSYTVAPASYTNQTIPNGSGLTTRDFLISAVNSYEDVAIYIIPNQQPRPGFTYTETIVYGNLGPLPVSVGQVQVDVDPLNTIISVSDPNATVTGNQINLNYSNLLPFEYRTFEVAMQVPVIPTVNLGDILSNDASITPIANDLTPNNNVISSNQVIIGSYDPNDKMESRGPTINLQEFTNDDYFYYTVRFQNTGTASAINVRIEDELDAQLDWESLEMISSSHHYSMQRVEKDVTWRFDNIMLPDSLSNPVGSNGYVYFKIKPQSGWTNGTVIPNTAEIYFDFNPPIITNTFTSTFTVPLSEPQVDQPQFTVFPNPATKQITVSWERSLDNGLMRIYDVSGKVTLSRKLNNQHTTVNIEELSAGMYFIEIEHNGQKHQHKLIKQ